MAEKNMNAKISVEFEETANRQQLSSGDNLPTLFGKIKKIISDLSTSAFSGSYIDLSDKPTTATTDTDGLMSAEDKGKLDSVDDTYALKSKYGDTTINLGRRVNAPIGDYSTSLGIGTVANGYASTAEGAGSQAAGYASHAGGCSCQAIKEASFAHGYEVYANHDYETAFGKHNVSNDDTLFSIGDGIEINTDGNISIARHNAFEITTTGGKLHDKDIATTDLIPTSLPANGGNADTVDGLHASDFMPINGEVRKYGTIRMNGSDGIRARHIDGNDEIDGALYLNWNSPNAPIYMNGGNTAIHSGNIGSQSVANAVTAHQVISPSYKVRLWEDNEGGNLELVAPDGVHMMQMDLYNNEGFRMYFYDGEKLNFPLSFDFSSQKLNINGNAETATIATSASNADTVNGLHAYNMATLNAGGGSNGTSFPMYCKHNVLGDNRFYIGVSGGYERSVAVGYAETAGSVPVNAIIKSATFTVTTNSSGWNTLGITYLAYNIIGYQCNTSDYRVELYKGNSATEWYVYAIQQYPNPGVVATNKAVSVTIFYI